MALIASSSSSNTRFYPSSPSIISAKQSRLVSVRAFSPSSFNARRHSFNPISISNAFNSPKNGNMKQGRVITCIQASTGKTCGRILLSDVEVKRQPRVYWGKNWKFNDIATGAVVLGMHVSCLLAPFTFTWPAFWLAVLLYVVTGLFGICLSFHRNLSHRSFKLHKRLEYTFAYCGAQAMQGNPMDWVSTHRFHHQFCGLERDPHSPFEGFWFSHMSWFFDTESISEKCGKPNNIGDLQKQPFYRFLESTYIFHPIALGVLLYALGGLPFLVWGMAVRTVWVYQITRWVALLAVGEGWHNNHHAFEFSARHGLEWWQLDMTWYVVKLLQVMGLATDVKLPSEVQKQRVSFSS